MDTVALRFPDNEIFREILAIYQIPVAGTSANISGKNSAVEIESIVSEFAGKINMIINDGTSRIGRESTIIGLEGGKVRMIRQGVIPIEDINNALGGK